MKHTWLLSLLIFGYGPIYATLSDLKFTGGLGITIDEKKLDDLSYLKLVIEQMSIDAIVVKNQLEALSNIARLKNRYEKVVPTLNKLAIIKGPTEGLADRLKERFTMLTDTSKNVSQDLSANLVAIRNLLKIIRDANPSGVEKKLQEEFSDEERNAALAQWLAKSKQEAAQKNIEQDTKQREKIIAELPTKKALEKAKGLLNEIKNNLTKLHANMQSMVPFTTANAASVQNALQTEEKKLMELPATVLKEFPNAQAESIKKYVQDTRGELDATIQSIKKNIQDLMTKAQQESEKQKKAGQEAEKAKKAQEEKAKQEKSAQAQLNNTIGARFKELEQLIKNAQIAKNAPQKKIDMKPNFQIINKTGRTVELIFSQQTFPILANLGVLRSLQTISDNINTLMPTFLLVKDRSNYALYAFMAGKTIYVTLDEDPKTKTLLVVPQKSKSVLSILNPETASGLPLKDNVTKEGNDQEMAKSTDAMKYLKNIDYYKKEVPFSK